MPTTMNVNEAKASFSNVLSHVQNERVTVTIMRYGHPVAQIVPFAKRRNMKPDPFLAKVKVSGSLFDDDSSDWEAMNG